jgi:Zn-dependent M28 family amino/carboxypeptidase
MDDETTESDIFQIAGAVEGGEAIPPMPIPILALRLDVGEEILHEAGVEPRGARDPPVPLEGVTITFRSVFERQTHQVPNVVAMIRGSDPDLADTYVILTAHFDHVGVGPPDATGDSIYSGADDNASGTSALLQVAEAFAALPAPPARSVLFLAVSGEEKGLLGSRHYAGSPTVPAEGMIANVNMDMVSRNHPDTVYAVGEEYTTLGDLAREVAAEHPALGLVVAPDPEPEEQAFLRSDHFSFVQRGIPALMLTTWLHEDYHLPSDTPDRVDPDKAARVARLAFLLSHRIASDPEPPRWTAEGEELLGTLTPPPPGR